MAIDEWGDFIFSGTKEKEDVEVTNLKKLLNEERDLFKRLTDHLQESEQGKKILMQFLALERMEGRNVSDQESS